MKSMRTLASSLAMGSALCVATPDLMAGATPLTSVRIASGLSRPLYVTHIPGDYSRIFIVEQRGNPAANQARIMVYNLNTNTLNATPFLVSPTVTTGSEQGLLGLAFHPDYMTNGKFYINYTNSTGATQIAQYTDANVNNDVYDAGSVTSVLLIAQPFSNHNGGWISFGPDGYLYIATGDGGSANDPGNRAQNVNDLLGKMLRIDVDSGFPYSSPSDNPFFGATNGRDEIWHIGLRNPWRNSFDRETGNLYIGDVGQDAWEEISFQLANTPGTLPGQSGYQGGKNFGWRCMEGLNCTGLSGCTCNATNLTLPIHTYSNNISGNCAVTGGYVYRGCAMPDMNGVYFFADYCSAQIWSFRYSPINGVTEFTSRTSELAPGGGLSIGSIAGFGEDAYGEIYICDLGGEVFKIIPAAPAPGPDCNSNGRRDACDILANPSLDLNGNGVLDSCEPPFEGPTLLSPQDDAVGVSVTPTLDWTDTGNTTSYRVEVDDNADFSSPEVNVAGLATSTFDYPGGDGIAPLAEDTEYYWRAFAVNNVGEVASAVFNFHTLTPPACAGDIDGDGDTDSTDLNIVLTDFGCETGCAGDADGDGDTDSTDLNIVLTDFGCA